MIVKKRREVIRMRYDELFEQRCLVASKLKDCLREKGYTKVSFAKKAEISRPALDRLLNGSMDSKTTFDRHLQRILKVMNMSVDRKRKILSTILLKCIGFSLNLEKGEDGFDLERVKTFIKAMGLEVYEDLINQNDDREFLNVYEAIYTSFLGAYEEITNTLQADKTQTETV